jgi:hypothetical protein
MEGLAVIVTILFTLAIISGPIAIVIARIKTTTFIALIIKRIFHGLFVALGTVVGAQWLLIPGLPFAPRLIGLASLCLCYVAARNEYFPEFRILERLGIQTKNNSEYGPVLKWRKRGSSSGKDGNGPEGQH